MLKRLKKSVTDIPKLPHGDMFYKRALLFFQHHPQREDETSALVQLDRSRGVNEMIQVRAMFIQSQINEDGERKTGHSFMPPDQISGTINRHLGKLKIIETPERAFEEMSKSKKKMKFECNRMNQNDWNDWKKLQADSTQVLTRKAYSTWKAEAESTRTFSAFSKGE